MTKDMTSGSPAKMILFFSLPILLGNIFQQLYNMVDTIIVGKCLGTKALAAVGSTGPLSFLILGFAIGITSGFSVITAQKFGAKDYDGVRKSVASSILLCTVFTLVLTIVSAVAVGPVLKLMNTPDDIYHRAHSYILTIYLGLFAPMLYNMIACTLRALGDSKTPLIFLAISSVLNILLDLLFITVFHMDVEGAALATILSQVVSGILCLIYTKKNFPMLHLHKEDFTSDLSIIMKKQLSIGLPMAFQFSITAIGIMILQSALNLFGSAKIAAFTAASKVEQLVNQPAVTFGTCIATYSGQNLGADKPERIKKGVRQATAISLCFAAAAILIILFFGTWLTELFLDEYNAEVIASSREYLLTIAFFLPTLNLLFIYRNALQGMGKSFVPLMAGVVELILRTVAAFTLPGLLGFQGICFAGPLAWVGATTLLGISYFTTISKLMKEHQQEKRLSL